MLVISKLTITPIGPTTSILFDDFVDNVNEKIIEARRTRIVIKIPGVISGFFTSKGLFEALSGSALVSDIAFLLIFFGAGALIAVSTSGSGV